MESMILELFGKFTTLITYFIVKYTLNTYFLFSLKKHTLFPDFCCFWHPKHGPYSSMISTFEYKCPPPDQTNKHMAASVMLSEVKHESTIGAQGTNVTMICKVCPDSAGTWAISCPWHKSMGREWVPVSSPYQMLMWRVWGGTEMPRHAIFNTFTTHLSVACQCIQDWSEQN